MNKIKTIVTSGLIAAGAMAMSSTAMAGVSCEYVNGDCYQVPEPSTLYLFGLALAGIAIIRKLRK